MEGYCHGLYCGNIRDNEEIHEKKNGEVNFAISGEHYEFISLFKLFA
jgi:hypothetical protein